MVRDFVSLKPSWSYDRLISGKYVATGSADTSAKVLDVHKMIAHSVNKGDREGDDKDIEASSSRSARPVTQTFYDHTEVQILLYITFYGYLIKITSPSSLGHQRGSLPPELRCDRDLFQ